MKSIDFLNQAVYSAANYVEFLFRLSQLFLLTMIVTHVGATAWFNVGIQAYFAGRASWVEEWDMLTPSSTLLHRGEDEHLWTQYVFSEHWSSTQVTAATMRVMPTNEDERLVSCIMIL